MFRPKDSKIPHHQRPDIVRARERAQRDTSNREAMSRIRTARQPNARPKQPAPTYAGSPSLEISYQSTQTSYYPPSVSPNMSTGPVYAHSVPITVDLGALPGRRFTGAMPQWQPASQLPPLRYQMPTIVPHQLPAKNDAWVIEPARPPSTPTAPISTAPAAHPGYDSMLDTSKRATKLVPAPVRSQSVVQPAPEVKKVSKAARRPSTDPKRPPAADPKREPGRSSMSKDWRA